MNIFDKSLKKSRKEIPLSTFAYLFSEFVQRQSQSAHGVVEMEERLAQAGYSIGLRVLDYYCYRERLASRKVKIVPLLQFISVNIWRQLFGKPADPLEHSTVNEDEYMISDEMPVTNLYISTPKEISNMNCAAFIAGIIQGILHSAGLPARVTAHSIEVEGAPFAKTTFLIKFAPEVVARERQ